jgi:hypothetical protein
MSTQTKTVNLQQIYTLTSILRWAFFYLFIYLFIRKIGTVSVYMKYELHWTFADKIHILTNFRSDHGVDDRRLVRQKSYWLNSFIFPNLHAPALFLEVQTHWTDFPEISYWGLLENLSRKFKSHENLIRTTGTSHEELRMYTYLNIYLSYSTNEKCFRQRLYSKWKHIF